jgi:hypothetical protein
LASSRNKEFNDASALEFQRLAAVLPYKNLPTVIAKRADENVSNVHHYLNYGLPKSDGSERSIQKAPGPDFMRRFKDAFKDDLLAAGFTEQDLLLPAVEEELFVYRTQKVLVPADFLKQILDELKDLNKRIDDLNKRIDELKNGSNGQHGSASSAS